jgi:hypothetical protein
MSDPLVEKDKTSIWKRPWRGGCKVGAWFALLAAGIFVVVCCIALANNPASPREVISVALIVSLLISGLGIGGVFFVRWLCCWRNLRRFLFVLACFATLILLFYAEENWRGKHAWQKHRQEWEAKGEKFELSALIPPPVPDEKNFAMAPLLKPMMDFTREPSGITWRDTSGTARLDRISVDTHSKDVTNALVLGSLEKGTLADLTASRDFYRGNTNYPQASPTATPSEAILVALGKFDPELTELRAAAASRPYARFPIEYDYQPTWGILLPHLARLRALTQLPHVRATAMLEAGRTDEAFEDLKLGLRVSDSIRDEPVVIDHLVRIVTLELNLQTVREGLARHAWSDAQLAELENYFGSVDILAEYRRAMRGERALTAAGLDYLRRNSSQQNTMQYLTDEGGASSLDVSFRFVPSGWFYQNMLNLSRMHQQYTLSIVDERARRVFPEVSAQGEQAVKQMRTGPYTILAKLLFPALEKGVRKSARMAFYVDATRVGCAVERYRLANGSLPETLDKLTPKFIERVPTDIMDGKPLRFRRHANNAYKVYSVGWNQTDDGGELVLTREKYDSSVDITRGDWVWEMAAR